MCLSIPVKILSIDGDFAEVSAGGTILRADIQMIDNPQAGDYVLLHAGFAIRKISEDDADEIFRLIEEIRSS